jgi:hypothetical protein
MKRDTMATVDISISTEQILHLIQAAKKSFRKRKKKRKKFKNGDNAFTAISSRKPRFTQASTVKAIKDKKKKKQKEKKKKSFGNRLFLVLGSHTRLAHVRCEARVARATS